MYNNNLANWSTWKDISICVLYLTFCNSIFSCENLHSFWKNTTKLQSSSLSKSLIFQTVFVFKLLPMFSITLSVPCLTFNKHACTYIHITSLLVGTTHIDRHQLLTPITFFRESRLKINSSREEFCLGAMIANTFNTFPKFEVRKGLGSIMNKKAALESCGMIFQCLFRNT